MSPGVETAKVHATAAATARLQVRLAGSASDIDAIVDLGREAYETGRYRNLPFAYERSRLFLEEAIKHPKTHGLLLAERGGEVVGCLLANCGRLVFADAIACQALLFYVRQDARASRAALLLLRAYEVWARNRRAVEISVHVTLGAENSLDIGKFFERKGFIAAGDNFFCTLS